MDIWGRLVPGVLCLLLASSYGVDPFDLRGLWSHLLSTSGSSWIHKLYVGEDNLDPFLLVIRLGLVGVVALLLGEIPVTITLKLRDWLFTKMPTHIQNKILREDASQTDKLQTYFLEHCGGVFPQTSTRSTFHRCKYALAVKSPMAYKLLRTYEARLNLYAGSLFPVVTGGLHLAAHGPLLFWLVTTAIVGGFLIACIYGYSIREIIVAEQSYYEMHLHSGSATTPAEERLAPG